jgi:hypothetical protein
MDIRRFSAQNRERVEVTGKIVLIKDLGGIFGGRTEVLLGEWAENRG